MNLRSATYSFRSGIVVMFLAGVCVLLTAVDKFSISFYTDVYGFPILALLGLTGAVVGILQHKKANRKTLNAIGIALNAIVFCFMAFVIVEILIAVREMT